MAEKSELDPLCPKRNFFAGFSGTAGKISAWIGGAFLAVWLVPVFINFAFDRLVPDVDFSLPTIGWPCETKTCGTADWVRDKWPGGDDETIVSESITETVIPASAAAEAPADPVEAEKAGQKACWRDPERECGATTWVKGWF